MMQLFVLVSLLLASGLNAFRLGEQPMQPLALLLGEPEPALHPSTSINLVFSALQAIPLSP
jgi:hypothetical protein